MDLQQKYTEYKHYVETCLSSKEINKPSFYAIAVFKALAELIQQGHVMKHASGVDIVERKALQQHVQMTFPAKDNSRRQEVNKYLSQRFVNPAALEPDFIEFVFEGDDSVYCREDKVKPGSKKVGYCIADFSDKDDLINFLLKLDLTLAYQRLTGDTLVELFDEYVQRKSYPTSSWYIGYQKTFNQITDDSAISDDTLNLLWYQRDNSVSSLRQGAPSHKEFETAKSVLREITEHVRNNPSAEAYRQAQQTMKQAKADGLLNKMYWALLNRVFAAIAPTICTSTIDEHCFRTVAAYLNERFALGMSLDGNWFDMNQEFKQAIGSHLPDNYDPMFVNMATWHLYEDLKNGRLNQIREDAQTGYEVEPTMNIESVATPLNQILYGPPGTGKTYHTIEASVKAAEPNFTFANRNELKGKYDELVMANRIRFVTFHQSYGYEEFVEGLSAKTEGDQVSYYEKDGIFKVISEEADKYRETKTVKGDSDFDSLWSYFIAELSQIESGIRVNTIRTFFTVTDVDNNTIRFEKDKGDSTHSLSVKTLKAIFNREREIKGGLNPYYSALIKHLAIYSNRTEEVHTQRKNFVLVIDEINRGNISKIFGELITLIEPSKRKGATEQIDVVLPHTGDNFSVPDNLHIIGTMNTADRSLAMMDTALRRRFDFVEMMPKPELLSGVSVNGIDLQKLLTVLNQRIEVLYDREHTLGHAFFMTVKEKRDQVDENAAFDELQSVFKNKIIPLLEEYFFEDWDKIRLVLADNQKLDSLQFVTEKQLDQKALNALFGSKHGLEQFGEAQKQYSLKSKEADVWSYALAYKGIYAPNQANETESRVSTDNNTSVEVVESQQVTETIGA
ncbi:McrB family protein [Photobacterium profundum]|uniref:GTPase subunit of restriction endonuclease n=1 Tax=Photobacterium profundum 3TCK TaxID=314280 RepID=Q1Z9T3_9GAMM|nr:AAA family ATPase [Photobacterium profundum]EAS45759.1 GTPase subunit of restriction endonuclease [Photobacterium profundum 3TCK]